MLLPTMPHFTAAACGGNMRFRAFCSSITAPRYISTHYRVPSLAWWNGTQRSAARVPLETCSGRFCGRLRAVRVLARRVVAWRGALFSFLSIPALSGGYTVAGPLLDRRRLCCAWWVARRQQEEQSGDSTCCLVYARATANARTGAASPTSFYLARSAFHACTARWLLCRHCC